MPVATPSTPKSPNRVSPSSSVPYIVRFIGGAGVSGGSGSVLLIPKDIPISVLDATRLVKLATPLLRLVLDSSCDTSGSVGRPGVPTSAVGLTVPTPEAPG